MLLRPPPSGGRGAKYYDKYFCLPVCLSTRVTRKPNGLTSLDFFLHVVNGPGSLLLVRCCDTLCNSGFAYDVMFSHNGHVTRHAAMMTTGVAIEIPTKFCSSITPARAHRELCVGVKSAIYDFSLFSVCYFPFTMGIMTFSPLQSDAKFGEI